MSAPLGIYIGYDAREAEAYRVCELSIRRRVSAPLHLVRLDQAALRNGMIYTRQWYRDVSGQRIDMIDGKPFSTDFTFTRFLVPALSLYQGWSLFCDGDFLFTGDLADLFALADARYAVMCVKHVHEPKEFEKMDGQIQTRYRRKNWSSLVLWNSAHPANRCLTLDCVNKMPGSWLHAFDWLKDDQIGELPREWNWLSGVDEMPENPPNGIHFTLGVPSMHGCEQSPYADLWRTERDRRPSSPSQRKDRDHEQTSYVELP